MRVSPPPPPPPWWEGFNIPKGYHGVDTKFGREPIFDRCFALLFDKKSNGDLFYVSWRDIKLV